MPGQAGHSHPPPTCQANCQGLSNPSLSQKKQKFPHGSNREHVRSQGPQAGCWGQNWLSRVPPPRSQGSHGKKWSSLPKTCQGAAKAKVGHRLFPPSGEDGHPWKPRAEGRGGDHSPESGKQRSGLCWRAERRVAATLSGKIWQCLLKMSQPSPLSKSTQHSTLRCQHTRGGLTA